MRYKYAEIKMKLDFLKIFLCKSVQIKIHPEKY